MSTVQPAKTNLPVFEWWRQQQFWTPEREEILTSWVFVNSFVDAHTRQEEYWQFLADKRVVQQAIHQKDRKKGPRRGPFSLEDLKHLELQFA